MAQYTPNYKLHQWESGDQFLRTDFNQDFAKIDTALKALDTAEKQLESSKAGATAMQQALSLKSEVSVGSFAGNGTTVAVTLGYRPKAVIVSLASGYYAEARIGIDGDNYGIIINDTGFSVVYNSNTRLNENNRTYRFLAFH